MARWGATIVATMALAASAAAPAHAVPDCTTKYELSRTVLDGRGFMETVLVDGQGRIFFGDLAQGVFRMDTPDSPPVQLSSEEGSGLARGPEGLLTIGSLDALFPPEAGLVGLEAEPAIGGLLATLTGEGRSALWTFDRDTGERTQVADKLSLVNGVAYDKRDGTYYATNHEGSHIVRVKDGAVDNRWALLPSANGVVVRGKWLYVTTTTGLPAIWRVRLADPSDIRLYALGGPEDAAAALDGLRHAGEGVMYVAAHAGGEIWRVDTERKPCAIVRGLDTGLNGPSDVNLGRGPLAGRLYVTTFSGKLLELSPAG